ncbi:MAG: hypothetical protein WCS56_02120 [Bacilli bacterium]
MRTRKVIVPKVLVKGHFPHPEDWGESMVVFLNGMYTDVFTDEKGFLFTMTNDEDLTNYIEDQHVKDEIVKLSYQNIELRTLVHKDKSVLLNWFSTNEVLKKAYDLYDSIDVFISHAITSVSHQFMISYKNKKIGYCGYTVVDEVAHIHFDLFTKENENQYRQGAMSIKLMIADITKKYAIKSLSTVAFIDDDRKKWIYFKCGFHIAADYFTPISDAGYKRVYLLTREAVLPKNE